MIRSLSIITLIAVLSSCDNSDHTYQGYVEGENIYLASPYSGALIQALVQRGQPVKKGDLLFTLDPNPQALQIKQATAALVQAKQVYDDLKKPRRLPEIAALVAQVSQAEAQKKLAALRVKRNQTLFVKHVLDKDSLDASLERYQELFYVKAQFQANLDLAKLGSRTSQIRAQKAKIAFLFSKQKEAEWVIAQKSFYAPADGVIFDTYFRLGEFVDANRPVAALLTPENIRIEFFVPADVLPRLSVGQNIAFDCDGCSKNSAAKIQYISPEAEYLPPLVYSRQNMDKLVFRIKASILAPELFKPGQPVVVTVSAHA